MTSSGEERATRERALCRAVLAGDEHAWRTLYAENFDRLCAYLSWRCSGLGDLAEDLVQETWLTSLRRIGQFDPGAGSFLGWLRGIAANILRNTLRRRRRGGTILPLDHLEPADRQPAATADAERIALALDALPGPYEEVLRAKYLDGLSVDAIAAQLGCTPKTIESRLSRARQAFRDAYLSLEDEP
jgi:RNA polymerase sigma-70 factor (ECF subfamily)